MSDKNKKDGRVPMERNDIFIASDSNLVPEGDETHLTEELRAEGYREYDVYDQFPKPDMKNIRYIEFIDDKGNTIHRKGVPPKRLSDIPFNEPVEFDEIIIKGKHESNR